MDYENFNQPSEIIKNPMDTIYSSQPRTKSESTLPAQTASLCRNSKSLALLLATVLETIVEENPQRLHERVLMDLMLSGGLRVSEVLQLRELKVNPLGQIFIFGSKGSQSKLVTPIYFRNFWLARSSTSLSPFIHISRFSFYKWLKTKEISLFHSSKEKNSVTHAFRHLHVYMLELMSIPEINMSEVIGHKSSRSLKFYLHGNKY